VENSGAQAPLLGNLSTSIVAECSSAGKGPLTPSLALPAETAIGTRRRYSPVLSWRRRREAAPWGRPGSLAEGLTKGGEGCTKTES